MGIEDFEYALDHEFGNALDALTRGMRKRVDNQHEHQTEMLRVLRLSLDRQLKALEGQLILEREALWSKLESRIGVFGGQMRSDFHSVVDQHDLDGSIGMEERIDSAIQALEKADYELEYAMDSIREADESRAGAIRELEAAVGR